jgi:hypothetical protein
VANPGLIFCVFASEKLYASVKRSTILLKGNEMGRPKRHAGGFEGTNYCHRGCPLEGLINWADGYSYIKLNYIKIK